MDISTKTFVNLTKNDIHTYTDITLSIPLTPEILNALHNLSLTDTLNNSNIHLDKACIDTKKGILSGYIRIVDYS